MHTHGAPGALDFAQRPLLVFWETTRACALACRHCRASALHDPLPGELTTAEGEALIDEVARFGTPPPVVVFTGGDCLERRDLDHLVARAAAHGLRLALAPSVTPALTPDRLAPLRALGARAVSISLDGARPDTHDAIRGVPGHFARTVEALRLLASEGFAVQVNTTVMRRNVGELADVAALLRDTGVHIWEVFFLIAVGRGIDCDELSPQQHEDVCHWLVDAARRGLVVRTVEAPFYRRVALQRADIGTGDVRQTFRLGPLYDQLAVRLDALLGGPTRAPAAPTMGTRDGHGIVFIAHNGDVYPSGFLPVPLGNVRTTPLVDLYRDHPLLHAIRRAEFSGRCGDCRFAQLCGGSRARAYARTGNPLASDPACPYPVVTRTPVGTAQ